MLSRRQNMLKWLKENKIIDLFLTFLKIGTFTFGGGYAMLALLENEFVSKRKWLTGDEFVDMTAIAESTPGPVAINSATYIGYQAGGFWGAAVSTFAVALPSFTVIYLISLFFDKFLSLKPVFYSFKGVQVCVVYLILSAGIKLIKKAKKSVFNTVIFSLVTCAMILLSLFSINFSSVYYILICGFIGVSAYLISLRGKKK